MSTPDEPLSDAGTASDRDLAKRALYDLLTGVAREGVTITYTELLDGMPEATRQVAEGDLAALLRELSVSEDEAGRGLLTAVVIRRAGGLPSGGFYTMAAERGRDIADRHEAWRAEIGRVHAAYAD